MVRREALLGFLHHDLVDKGRPLNPVPGAGPARWGGT